MRPRELAQLAACDAWRAVLGSEAVDTAHDTLDRYARSTGVTTTRPCAVLYPAHRDQVVAALAVAREHGVPLHPIARGRNWGYGDACAPVAGGAILDCSRMDRILEVNAELGYAVIEPGVTQQQLYEAVRREAPGFWIDATGAGPGASIVGNLLERGFGHTPGADHVRTTCGLEVVLPDGRILRTGLWHFEQAKAAPVYPYGLGPMLDGLFSQSSFGVVTRACIWLVPAPEAFRFFWLSVPREEDLAPLMDALRPLRMQGVLNSAVHFGNDLRVFAAHHRYPWNRAQGKTPLPKALRDALRAETGCGLWNVSGSLTGTSAQVRANTRTLRRAVRPFARMLYLDDFRMYWLERYARFCDWIGIAPDLRRQLEALRPNYGLLKGIPTSAPLAATRWRLRSDEPPVADPRDIGCGLLWLAPVLPLRGQDARAVLDLLAPVFEKHGFDLPVTFTMVNERALIGVINISFDRRHAEECAQAAACYQEAAEALLEAGYPPYRANIHTSTRYADPADVFWQLAGEIKALLDPHGIVSPGKFLAARRTDG